MSRHLDQINRIKRALTAEKPVRVSDPARARAAVALVIAPSSAGPELLVIRRARRDGDPWSGQMALPGGRYEEGDAGLLGTAVRETREETSVRLVESDCLGELSDLAPTTPVLPAIRVRPFVFGLPERPEVQLNPEADRYLWVGLSALGASAGRAAVTVRGVQREVSGFLVGGEVIWGMTHRIIMPFLDLVND